MTIDHLALAQNYFRHVNERAAKQIEKLFVELRIYAAAPTAIDAATT